MSAVCFTCLSNLTHDKLHCVGNYVYQMVNDIRAHRGNACVRISLYTAELQDRAPLQAQSAIQFRLVRESSYTRDCLSWHWISWRLPPLKFMLNDFSQAEYLVNLSIPPRLAVW